MTDDAEYDALFDASTRKRFRKEYGTTNILAVKRAILDCDLQFLAQHLRTNLMPGRAVCVALANLLDPPPSSDQCWRLERKRVARGRPARRLEKRERRIILDHNRELLDQLARGKPKRGLRKFVAALVAERHGVDEKTVRNLLNRTELREP